MTVNTLFFFWPNIYKKQHGARPCVEKMQLIFFVPPNEELEIAPQKFGCTPKNEGKRVHVPPDEKTCGHADHDHWKNPRRLETCERLSCIQKRK